ncbi:MAG: FIST C-terminal domain-containing protein [Oligoflexales bacterium]|nr:FIST C-terminal domain-containing protein [Oligoflexales bacterium]
MATKAGVGISINRKPKLAIQEAYDEAKKAVGDSKINFAFLYSTIGYKQDSLISSFNEVVGSVPMCGCSTAGVLGNEKTDESNFAISMMLISSDEIRFQPVMKTGLKEDSFGVGSDIASSVNNILKDDSFAVIALGDGLTINFDRFLSGFEGTVKKKLPIFGGTAGDGWQWKQTYQYCNGEVISNGMVCVVISGKGRIATSVNHGCLPIGNERKVTKSEGNVIYEIDNKPVLDVLKEYAGNDVVDNWSKAVVSLSWGFESPNAMKDAYDQLIIRFMPGKDDEKKCVFLPAEVQEGCSIWMTRRDSEKIVKGIEKLGEEINRQLGGEKPKLVFHFDCAGRGECILSGDIKRKYIDTIRGLIGTNVPTVGFYSYGEIGPVNNINCFHNYTAVLLVIY